MIKEWRDQTARKIITYDPLKPSGCIVIKFFDYQNEVAISSASKLESDDAYYRNIEANLSEFFQKTSPYEIDKGEEKVNEQDRY